MMIIGVDYHPSFQTIAFLIEETGECDEQELNHKGLLRHASVVTTQKQYIKEVPEITRNAMEKIETLCTNRATAANK